MKIRDCFVGTRVECTKSFAGIDALIGEIGTIVHIYNDRSVGVDFDIEFSDGHDCGGYSRTGHGRYGSPDCLRRYEEPDPVITLDFDTAMHI